VCVGQKGMGEIGIDFEIDLLYFPSYSVLLFIITACRHLKKSLHCLRNSNLIRIDGKGSGTTSSPCAFVLICADAVGL
jgi:hypothetical protein